VTDLLLNVGDDLPGIGLIPAPIEILGGKPELDHQIAGQVFRLDFSPLLPPQPDQRRLVASHNDPGIRAADIAAATGGGSFPHGIFHISAPWSKWDEPFTSRYESFHME